MFIRSQDINSDELRIDGAAHVQIPGDAEGLRTRVERDDLLITITGANVTRAARVVGEVSEAYVSQHVALMRLAERRLAPLLHLWLVAETGGRGQLKIAAYGLGKPGLNLNDIAKVVVPVPPLNEQHAMTEIAAAHWTRSVAVGHAVADVINQLGDVDRAMLAKAFRGELVPHDPNDEPASVLLERIRTERDAEAAAGNGGAGTKFKAGVRRRRSRTREEEPA